MIRYSKARGETPSTKTNSSIELNQKLIWLLMYWMNKIRKLAKILLLIKNHFENIHF
jgi:hypothetical protein